MGDGGWRRIDAAAARHILTRGWTLGFSDGASWAPSQAVGRAERSGGRLSAQYEWAALHRRPLFLCESALSGRRQRGQKPLAAPRYSITVTLRRIRI